MLVIIVLKILKYFLYVRNHQMHIYKGQNRKIFDIKHFTGGDRVNTGYWNT